MEVDLITKFKRYTNIIRYYNLQRKNNTKSDKEEDKSTQIIPSITLFEYQKLCIEGKEPNIINLAREYGFGGKRLYNQYDSEHNTKNLYKKITKEKYTISSNDNVDKAIELLKIQINKDREDSISEEIIENKIVNTYKLAKNRIVSTKYRIKKNNNVKINLENQIKIYENIRQILDIEFNYKIYD